MAPVLSESPSAALTEAEAEHHPRTPPEPTGGGTAKLKTVKTRHQVSHKKCALNRHRGSHLFNSLETGRSSYVLLWLQL